MKTVQVQALSAMIGLVCFVGTAQAALQVHLPFEGNVNDVAGSHTTALIDGADGSSSYVQGSVGNGIHFTNPAKTGNEIDYVSIDYTMTNEGSLALWYTADSLYNYQTVFANSVQIDDWEMWVYGDGRARGRIQGGANNTEVTRPGVVTEQPYHIAFTWDRDDSDLTQATVNLYFDGSLVESKTGDWVDPGNTVFIAGGNGNHGANATFDDFRIYDHTLSASEVTALYDLGPDPLSLQINRDTGEILLQNTSDRAYTIDSYEITSLNGSLNTGGWNSFENQDFEGNGAPGTGNGWEEAGGVNDNQLIESYLTGASAIADGASISLGNAFATGNAEDILFTYHLSDGNTISTPGEVSYIGAVSNADFDGNGKVDGVDFLTWQRGAGAAGGLLQGDANGDGQVNNADLTVWQGQYGSANSTATAGAVPEPSTAVLISLALVGLAPWVRRCRAISTSPTI